MTKKEGKDLLEEILSMQQLDFLYLATE